MNAKPVYLLADGTLVIGLSTDPHPTDMPDNYTLFELDTLNVFTSFKGQWVKQQSQDVVKIKQDLANANIPVSP